MRSHTSFPTTVRSAAASRCASRARWRGAAPAGRARGGAPPRHYRSLANWRHEMEAAQDPASEAWAGLLDIHGIGEEMAADIIGFFAEPHNRAVLDDLSRKLTVLDWEAPAQRT